MCAWPPERSRRRGTWSGKWRLQEGQMGVALERVRAQRPERCKPIDKDPIKPDHLLAGCEPAARSPDSRGSIVDAVAL